MNHQMTAQEIFDRLNEIDFLLADYFISWAQTQKLIEEHQQLIEQLNQLGYRVDARAR